MNPTQLRDRYRRYLCTCEPLGLSVDISRMAFADELFDQLSPALDRAFNAMAELEAGGIANPDENRRVGHYWLRAPQLAPEPAIRQAIEQTTRQIQEFADQVHREVVAPPFGGMFLHLLVAGIGGSALGPQLLTEVLGGSHDPLEAWYLDNTDPDGFDRIFARLGDQLSQTLVLVISKSGGTLETRNAMLETMARFEQKGLSFPAQAAAITQPESQLDHLARQQDWLARFPLWDFVGGRTSITSAVGLLPAALQGFDVDAFLAGVRQMDEITRHRDPLANPAALLAAMWHYAGRGRGDKQMVIIPYKDRLAPLARYLQQLVMESLGKESDLQGNVVHQGLTVYGNKGSTDQHAYIQQLRDGRSDFFVTFVRVLRDRAEASVEIEPRITSGDYLHGFLLGTRAALWEKGRESITITLTELNATTLGALIALYERAVGLYAAMVGINAYHQPGVEAGKKAAQAVMELQRQLLVVLQGSPGDTFTAQQLAEAAKSDDLETVEHILAHLAANPDRGVQGDSQGNWFWKQP